MRILFSFIGGVGHFHPLIPVARAAEAAGHEVAVAGSGALTAAIGAAGFRAFATSEVRSTVREPDREPPRLDPEADERQLRDGFADTGARRHTEHLPGIAAEFKPDVLVRDEVDLGAAIVAELLGLPCATVIVLGSGGFLRKDLVAPPLHTLRADLGLPPDPGLAMLDRGLILSPFPPSLRNPEFPLPDGAFHYRAASAPPPRRAAGTPTVYFTLGTVGINLDLFSRVLAGLRELPATIVMTVGQGTDPAEFGPQPDHVRIERYIPQDDLLPTVDLVVSHAGSGSLIGTLAHGLPTLLLPLSADQPHNARRCTALGFGQVLDPVTVTPDQVREAAQTVLADPAYRVAAEHLRDEIDALPSVDATIPLIEQLASTGVRSDTV
ncbi:MAG TPA: nucleotide disphospho-sugar-binding domain-containing protein [Actinocrinis sp.]|nr:nucleotide disphospho-sugar-binding domain-containing protein [Actinocrinis sp.]